MYDLIIENTIYIYIGLDLGRFWDIRKNGELSNINSKSLTNPIHFYDGVTFCDWNLNDVYVAEVITFLI
jgi:hypothetical protein